MYRFSDEERKAYEAFAAPAVFYQYTDGKIMPVLLTDGFCRLMGLERETADKMFPGSVYDRIHPEDAPVVAHVSEEFANHRSEYDLVFRARHEDGYHPIHAVGHWQTMEDGTELAVLVYLDLTTYGQAADRLSESFRNTPMARFFRDPLTGKPNINYFNQFAQERVNAIRAGGGTPMLIYSDVTSMQFYNNEYGFMRGNDLLVLIADTLSECFPGALLVRGADDHFMIIDRFNGEEEIAKRLEEANSLIRSKAYGNTSGIQAGVYVMETNVPAGKAIDHARTALKMIGSDMNRTYMMYSAQTNQEYWNQRYIVQNLDRALEEKWIKIFYQGIARLETNRTAAFEALARWNDPVRGTIMPGEFIPALGKYHLLYKLDLYMVDQVFAEFKTRKEANLPLLPVSVNFAGQDFDVVNIPAEIDRLYEKHGMAEFIGKESLIIEITEHDMATATDRFNAQLQELRAKGYRLWLDDFGSGYSSLNVFSRFEIDLVKFDMELIRHLDEHNGANRKILKAMISISKELGIHTLVEGVETTDQRGFLQETGCELYQGFLYRIPEALGSILFKVGNGLYVPSCETEEERKRFLSFGRE